MRHVIRILFTCWLVIAACSAPVDRVVDDAAIAGLDQGGNWLAFGRAYDEQRFSPLDAINESTIAQLGVAWHSDLPNDRTLYGTPLVVDGIMYYEGSYNVLRAVNATTGEQLWEYNPQVIEHAGDRLRIMWDVSRGIAFYEGRVYLATGDGRLIAVDAATGREVWSTLTVDPAKPLVISGAPKAFRGLVVIGNGGTEWGAIRGYLDAYDARTGERVWRWHTVPGNPADGFENDAMAMAAETWTGEWWKFGGGGTVWHGITYDPDFDQVLIGTGNGTPWNQRIRSPGGGDNLFLSSVVALDATTGTYKWHYQNTPGETWDYNSNMDIVLADLTIDGRQVKAAMHAPKNGFFYVIDRADGRLLSAEPYTEVTWATHVDMATGRPVEVPEARYADAPALVFPSALGGHSWHAMSFNPGTGFVYIPVIELAGGYGEETINVETWQSPTDFRFETGTDPGITDVPEDAGSGSLKAWDPVAQQVAWVVEKPGIWSAGTLTTAGNLVFQGQGDGYLVAHRATDGAVLWSANLGLGISAPPITYAVDGRQYVAILVGWGGAGAAFMGSLAAKHGWAYKAQPRRLVVFALGGDVALPAAPPPVVPTPIPNGDFVLDQGRAAAGAAVYASSCTMCHGSGAVSGGTAPDLRASSLVLSRSTFEDVVVRGSLRANGMSNFPNLSPDEVENIRHYIRSMASPLRE
ncbi:MAG: PQQ-dependent dehydrogenase, methanol/ethanol family [Gemmatimonadales bacterium]